jgi:hypothetical protein
MYASDSKLIPYGVDSSSASLSPSPSPSITDLSASGANASARSIGAQVRVSKYHIGIPEN